MSMMIAIPQGFKQKYVLTPIPKEKNSKRTIHTYDPKAPAGTSPFRERKIKIKEQCYLLTTPGKMDRIRLTETQVRAMNLKTNMEVFNPDTGETLDMAPPKDPDTEVINFEDNEEVESIDEDAEDKE